MLFIFLLGDLAEIVTLEPSVDNLSVGPGGQWNDSTIPTNYFLMTDYKNIALRNWKFTDSEFLGDLDGMIAIFFYYLFYLSKKFSRRIYLEAKFSVIKKNSNSTNFSSNLLPSSG